MKAKRQSNAQIIEAQKEEIFKLDAAKQELENRLAALQADLDEIHPVGAAIGRSLTRLQKRAAKIKGTIALKIYKLRHIARDRIGFFLEEVSKRFKLSWTLFRSAAVVIVKGHV
jgi:hypothetical protein